MYTESSAATFVCHHYNYAQSISVTSIRFIILNCGSKYRETIVLYFIYYHLPYIFDIIKKSY